MIITITTCYVVVIVIILTAMQYVHSFTYRYYRGRLVVLNAPQQCGQLL